MNIEALETDLPNGLHDARLLAFMHLEDEQRVEFVVELWTGDLQSEVREVRERFTLARIELLGLDYFAVDKPHPDFLVRGAQALTIDACPADPAQDYSRNIPEGGFAGRLYVTQWNAFMHFAARDLRLTWLGGN